MALFGLSKDKDTEKKAKPAKADASRLPESNLTSVLIAPRITEKAALLSGQGTYTFLIRRDATKRDVKAAVKALYDVTPAAVRIVNHQPRTEVSRLRGRKAHQPGMRKAYVTLKDGDRIELV